MCWKQDYDLGVSYIALGMITLLPGAYGTFMFVQVNCTRVRYCQQYAAYVILHLVIVALLQGFRAGVKDRVRSGYHGVVFIRYICQAYRGVPGFKYRHIPGRYQD